MQNSGPSEHREGSVWSDPVPMKILNTRVPEDIHAVLSRYAKARGSTPAAVAREAVIFYVGWLHAQETKKPPTDKR